MKSALKEIYEKYPLLVIIAVFLIFWAFTVWIMRKMTLAKKVEGYSTSEKEIMELSYLGQSQMPRGIRNNNPGNLVKTAITWQGKITPSADSRFEQFKSFVWGLRAKIRDTRNDIKLDGTNTIRKLISEFAPEFENNTSGYINQVCNYMNMGPDDRLTGSKEEMRKLTKIIARVENGNPQPLIGRNEWFDDRMFDVAWDLSL